MDYNTSSLVPLTTENIIAAGRHDHSLLRDAAATVIQQLLGSLHSESEASLSALL